MHPAARRAERQDSLQKLNRAIALQSFCKALQDSPEKAREIIAQDYVRYFPGNGTAPLKRPLQLRDDGSAVELVDTSNNRLYFAMDTRRKKPRLFSASGQAYYVYPYWQRVWETGELPPQQDPDEIWMRIFAELGPQDLLRCRLVCRRFAGIAADNSLWKPHWRALKCRLARSLVYLPKRIPRAWIPLVGSSYMRRYLAFQLTLDSLFWDAIREMPCIAEAAIHAFQLYYSRQEPTTAKQGTIIFRGPRDGETIEFRLKERQILFHGKPVSVSTILQAYHRLYDQRDDDHFACS